MEIFWGEKLLTLFVSGDSGFRKWGFDRQVRRSFTDWMDRLVQNTNGRFRYFLPCLPDDPYLDTNFNPAGNYLNRAPGNRHRARTANSSAASVTKSRWHVESCFGREYALQIMGVRSEVPQHYLSACQIPGHANQPRLFVWLCIGDVVINRFTNSFQHIYPTVDTYNLHGMDIRMRIEKENPLSEYSGITWSRTNIFKKPTQNELGQGYVRKINLLNSNQTGMVGINFNELSSMTLGSFQPKLANSYVSKLRRLQVAHQPYVNLQLSDL